MKLRWSLRKFRISREVTQALPSLSNLWKHEWGAKSRIEQRRWRAASRPRSPSPTAVRSYINLLSDSNPRLISKSIIVVQTYRWLVIELSFVMISIFSVAFWLLSTELTVVDKRGESLTWFIC